MSGYSRAQVIRTQNLHRSTASANNTAEPEPPNLTNPKRVKKLTKFFGEDPPLMRLFLRTLGYEVSEMHNKTHSKSRYFIEMFNFSVSYPLEICESIRS